jgi:hypothetical protein
MMKFRIAVDPLSETVGVFAVTPTVVFRSDVLFPAGTVSVPACAAPAITTAAVADAMTHARLIPAALFFAFFRCVLTLPSNPAKPEEKSPFGPIDSRYFCRSIRASYF